MSWSNPRTFSIGEVLTASNLNAYVSSDLGVVPVSTTVSGLNTQYYGGAQTNGSVGIIRAGSTPYDFLVLTYDSTYAKWISPAQQVLWGCEAFTYLTINTWASSPPTGTSGATSGLNAGAFISYKPFTDAGLTLQVRVRSLAKTGAGHTMNIGVYLTPYAVNGAAGTPSADTSLASTTSTSYVMIDSGWVNAPSFTADASCLIQMRAMNTATDGANALVAHGSTHIRWVG